MNTPCEVASLVRVSWIAKWDEKAEGHHRAAPALVVRTVGLLHLFDWSSVAITEYRLLWRFDNQWVQPKVGRTCYLTKCSCKRQACQEQALVFTHDICDLSGEKPISFEYETEIMATYSLI